MIESYCDCELIVDEIFQIFSLQLDGNGMKRVVMREIGS